VDNGLSGKELYRRLDLVGLDPTRIEAVLVSHEHRDHILGVGVVARKLHLPVYITEETYDRVAPVLGSVKCRPLAAGRDLRIGELSIHPFSVSHDAVDPVGFTFTNARSKLGLATDLGVSTALVKEHLAECGALIIEANHDPQMLMDGPYPWETKRRVRGRQGHLSNDDSAELLEAVFHRDLTKVVLAHLSETNNRPELALDRVREVLRRRTTEVVLTAARQGQPGPVIDI
jgi:phosphoribosyl 1,2-cyclic phosphodiesterase